MGAFLEIILSFPTVVFTVPFVLSVLYWLMVIIGAADIDALDGAVDGVVEGAAEGAAEGAVEGAADVVDGADTIGEAGGLLAFLKLRSAPVTVVFSLFSIFSWMLSILATYYLGPVVGGTIPAIVFSTLVVLLTTVAATFVTSVAIRPLAPLFVHVTQKGGRHLAGKTVKISTRTVDDKFGQAQCHEGGNDLLLDVRTATAGVKFKKHDEVVIIDYDEERDVYLVDTVASLTDKSHERSPRLSVDVDASQNPDSTSQKKDAISQKYEERS